MLTERQWYYSIAGQKAGPIPEGELMRLRDVGVINDASLVWTEGWPGWRALGSVDELRRAPLPPPPPLLTPPAPATAPGETDSLATASLILGVLGLSGFLCCATGPLSILAVIMGHLTLAKPGLDSRSKQLATIGLIVGYLGLVFLFLPLIFGMFWGGWGNHLPDIFRRFHHGVGI